MYSHFINYSLLSFITSCRNDGIELCQVFQSNGSSANPIMASPIHKCLLFSRTRHSIIESQDGHSGQIKSNRTEPKIYKYPPTSSMSNLPSTVKTPNLSLTTLLSRTTPPARYRSPAVMSQLHCALAIVSFTTYE